MGVPFPAAKLECEARAFGENLEEIFRTRGKTKSFMIADLYFTGESITIGFDYYLSVFSRNYAIAIFEGIAKIYASVEDLSAIIYYGNLVKKPMPELNLDRVKPLVVLWVNQ